MRRARENDPRLAAGNPCQDEEDDFDEEEDELQEDEDNASESNSSDADLSDGADPGYEDPNVDVDVETDTETDADTDVDAEIDADTDVGADVDVALEELFFEADVEPSDDVGIDYVSGPGGEDEEE